MYNSILKPGFMRKLAGLSIVVAIVAVLLMVYNAYAYLDFQKLLNQPEIYSKVVAVNAMIVFFAHLLFLITIILIISTVKVHRWWSMVELIIGTLSFVALLGHWGCLTDIAKELPMGWDVSSEVFIVYLALLGHVFFFITLLFYLPRIMNALNRQTFERSTLMSENLYIVMHLVGLLSASLGLYHVIPEFYLNLSVSSRKWFVLPVLLIVSIPYLIAVAGWMFYTIRDWKAHQVDEKQIRDLSRAGLSAWLVSIPVMVVMFIINYQQLDGMVSIMWLPMYLYTTLLVFSGSGLYFFRNA